MAISRWFDINVMLLIVIRLFSQTDSLLSHFLSAQKYKWAPVEYQQNLMTYLEAPCNSISCWGVTIFIVTLDPGISFTHCVLQTFEDLTELNSTFQVCELENLSWLGATIYFNCIHTSTCRCTVVWSTRDWQNING